VGQHIHNELVQWYIPLPGSKLTYIAGGDQYPMKGGDVSFTPTGFHHGAQAEAGDSYDYIWFELCCDGYPGEIK
jgi:gentisate 1,2-dioxygenase